MLVTSAGQSGTEERQARLRRYLLTQSLRLVCLVLAVALPVPVWGKLLLVVGALVLPWMGVVAANGGPKRERIGENAMVERVEPVRLQLDPARTVDMD
ncbi:MAG: hypothetical protein JWO22_2141 [Frankiales bacterium]|nr:hypothetical protein [Frankiales bacterium]